MAFKVTTKLIDRWLNDIEHYGRSCLQIRDKDANTVPFSLNEPQQIINTKLKEQWAKHGYIRAIVLKARQEGVSTYTGARFFRRCHLMKNQEALVVADEDKRSATIMSIYDRYLSNLPPECRPMVRSVQRAQQIVFDNPNINERATNPGLGSKISVETANDKNAGRGSTLQMLHASEMAFWQNPDDVWLSLMQTVPDKNSEVIIESTANGHGNLFHTIWTEAVAGINDFLPIFLPWWIDSGYTIADLSEEEREFIMLTLDDTERKYLEEGITLDPIFGFGAEPHKLTVEQLAWRRRTIRTKCAGDMRKFRQEYPATPEEAFVVSGNCFFDADAVVRYQETATRPKFRANLVHFMKSPRIVRAELGYLRVWRKPDEYDPERDRLPIYVIGADTASGKLSGSREQADPFSERGGRDFSCGWVLDVANRRYVAKLHGRMAPEVFAQQLFLLGHLYSSPGPMDKVIPALIAVEKNHSSGETVLRKLKTGLTFPPDKTIYTYPRLYYGKKINRRVDKRTDLLGWSTTGETRMPMLDEFSAALREETVDLPCWDTLNECLTFVLDESGKPGAEDGCHDDRVFGAAIALQMVHAEVLHRPRNFNKTDLVEVGSSPTGMFDW